MNSLCALLLLVVLGGEPFRFEPRPETVPLPSPPDAAESAGNAAADVTPADIEVLHAPADLRPLCYVHTVKRLCKPCDEFGDWWLVNCDEFPLNVVPVEYESFEALPQWVRERGVPLAHYESERQPTGWASATWNEKTILATWKAANPGRSLTAAAMTGASPFDQIQKFTGAGGSFTFQPDQPIAASLDDRTSIRYPSIQGRYAVENGVVTIKLEPPLPVGNYRKFLNFGFTINGARGPENVTAQSADITIQTNRGDQKMKIEMEPKK